MNLSLEQAKQIIDVFGPCTTLYECREPRELVEEAASEPDLETLVLSLLASEGLYLEQRGNQWSGENEAQFREDVAADKVFLSEVRTRVLDYLKSGKPAPPVVNGCEYILQPYRGVGPRNVVRREKKS